MAVADVYDALRSARVYKPAMPREQARAIITEGAGAHFDARIVAAFLLVEPQIARIADALSDPIGDAGMADTDRRPSARAT